MTRINWDEVRQLKRLDEIIAYSIITLQEAYTARDNDDTDVPTKNDIRDWIRWEIGYDDAGRAYFRYAAMLYVVDTHPMADVEFLNLIVAPTKYLVRHKAALHRDRRVGDTALEIDLDVDLPTDLVNTLERLLFWAICLGEWWNRVLTYLLDNDLDPLPAFNWGNLESPFPELLTEPSGTIDAQFDEYNGKNKPDDLPDFLQNLLEPASNSGLGDFAQDIDLSGKDLGTYRENLVTCEEQDPKIVSHSQEQLNVLLPK